MPTRQGELARNPATRDKGKLRRRVSVTRQKTELHTITRILQPRGSCRPFAQRRRRTNLHRIRGRLDASSRQPRISATSCPLSAVERAPRPPPGLSAPDRAPPVELTRAPMPAPWSWHMRRRGPSGRLTTTTRRFSGVKPAYVGLTNISSRQRPLRERRPW